jgi:hypothetical protein
MQNRCSRATASPNRAFGDLGRHWRAALASPDEGVGAYAVNAGRLLHDYQYVSGVHVRAFRY